MTTRNKVIVGHTDGRGPTYTFSTADKAADFIGSVIRKQDPIGVHRGDYYIDVPEWYVG